MLEQVKQIFSNHIWSDRKSRNVAPIVALMKEGTVSKEIIFNTFA
jgi:hypothetical protein